MKILKAYPPNFTEIKAAFPAVVGRQGVLYSWGDKVYNPSGITVPEWLMRHEAVHFKQQQELAGPHEALEGAVRKWWDLYIRSMAFRLLMEIPAHQVEYRAYTALNKDKKKRYLNDIASRLSGPLYGYMLTHDEAVKEILNDTQRQQRTD